MTPEEHNASVLRHTRMIQAQVRLMKPATLVDECLNLTHLMAHANIESVATADVLIRWLAYRAELLRRLGVMYVQDKSTFLSDREPCSLA